MEYYIILISKKKLMRQSQIWDTKFVPQVMCDTPPPTPKDETICKSHITYILKNPLIIIKVQASNTVLNYSGRILNFCQTIYYP